MKTQNINPDNGTVITIDTTGITSNCRSIEFYNDGEQKAFINTNIPLAVGESLIFGDERGAYVTNDFSISFSGTGIKKVVVTKESIS